MNNEEMKLVLLHNNNKCSRSSL